MAKVKIVFRRSFPPLAELASPYLQGTPGARRCRSSVGGSSPGTGPRKIESPERDYHYQVLLSSPLIVFIITVIMEEISIKTSSLASRRPIKGDGGPVVLKWSQY